MLPVRIIPCLDVRDGRVVKGVKFQGLKDQGDPAALSRAYEEQGADEVVVLDVTATPEARGTRLDTVLRCGRGCRCPSPWGAESAGSPTRRPSSRPARTR